VVFGRRAKTTNRSKLVKNKKKKKKKKEDYHERNIIAEIQA